MMKLLKILMLWCICASTYANDILASYLEWQSVSSAKGTYNIVLSLYVDEASEAHKLAAQHVHLFRDDDHWKANGQRIPFGFFALKRLSSTKIEQDTTVCSNTAKPNIFLDVYVSISPVSIDPVFRANGYFLTWNPRLNRGGDDVNIANSGNFEECVITYIPPLTAESTDHSSSPAIGELKTFYACKDKYSTIQLPAIDKDGDALKYKLASPIGVVDHDSYLEDVDLIWANGCNGSNQMTGSPGLQVDENSGLLSVTPDKLGQHLVGIAVEEYRNGKKLGAVIVYYTIVVTECKEDIDPDPQIYSDTTAVTTLTICQGSEATLSSHQSFPDPQPQFQWTKDGKVIWGATSQSIAVSEAGEYQLSTTKIAGCPDSFDSETVQVIVGSSSGAEMDSIPPICDITTPPIALNATPSGGTFTGMGVSGNTFDPQIAGVGSHEVEYAVEGSEACPGSATKRQVVVSETPVLDLTDVLYASRGNPIAIGVKDSLDLTYQWLPPAYLNNGTFANPISTPLTGITYTVTATNEYGCTATREVKVVIVESILIPDAFTPNQDGINETWDLKGIESYPDCEVTLYNRWGEVIFNSVGYKTPFDGTVEGAPQMPGVYAYKIRLTENSPYLTGAVMLLR